METFEYCKGYLQHCLCSVNHNCCFLLGYRGDEEPYPAGILYGHCKFTMKLIQASGFLEPVRAAFSE